MSTHEHFFRTGKGRLSALALVIAALSVAMPASAGTYGYGPGGQYGMGDSLAANVKAAIAQNPYLSMMPIHVSTSNGIVRLTGYVDNFQDKFRPENIAKGVPGVRDVQNDLVARNVQESW